MSPWKDASHGDVRKEWMRQVLKGIGTSSCDTKARLDGAVLWGSGQVWINWWPPFPTGGADIVRLSCQRSLGDSSVEKG